VVKLVRRAEALGVKVVVSGCVPQADRHARGLEAVSLLGTRQIDRVVEVVEETLKGHRVVLLEKKELPSLDLPKVRLNPWVEIISINTGCLGSCTYCKTKHARGVLGSYKPEEIFARTRAALEAGVKEIWLTSEDTGAYGLDVGTNIAELLAGVVRVLEDFPGAMLRLGMTNPPYMLQHVEAVGRLLRHPQVYEFLHVPIQSASDRVLYAMNREYRSADFRRLARGLRENCPGITIATDIICGFPTEAEAEHEETLALLQEEHFPVVNITGFYARPNTPAARMEPVDPKVLKRRVAEMFAAFHAYTTWEALVGTEADVLFTETDRVHQQIVGHTKSYAKVVLPIGRVEEGSRHRVRITAAQKFHVVGELL
jgi:threonylcarbamoyladenosine tRNA methylthiotransferase CDKAL1